ncbi:MAG TPA: Ig-like domain repeat protein, partial [Edaphobacter sp.]|nr:Ig-like domain repeat protein [Edaphobacter sp.]
QITVTQAIPSISWTTPASIIYGTALSATQLDATASVPGSLVYTPAAGAVLTAGNDTLSVTFTPTDTTNYTTATKTVQLTVNQATPVVTWAPPAAITYGVALSGAQLNATASVPGSFAYTPAVGSIPTAGNDTLSVTFTPTDTTNYSAVTQTVQLIVNQATPAITWNDPATITYGTALSGTQLNASASVPGTLVYTPAAGEVPLAGTDTLSVTFNPTDTTNYTSATKTVQITVNQATPLITWTTPAAITYGTPLSPTQLNATASVPGSFVYTPAGGSITPAGVDTLSVTFTPTDTSNYTTATKTVQLTVNQATPIITWATPAGIVYGTVLNITQLNATASVPGTLVYTPAAGSIPLAGTDTLSVTFTPTDTNDYTGATKTVQIVVSQATPVITWSTPASIVYGTALSNNQLDATAPVDGSFVYTPPAGTEFMIGTHQLSVTFTPTDLANYTTASKTVSLDVTQAVLTVSANNFSRLYGTANPTFTGSVTGAENGDTFTESFSNSATILSTVGQYGIVPSVTGNNLSDYTQVVQNGTLSVTKAPAITTTTLSTSTIAFGLNVTLTATVKSTTTGTPTGNVSFFDNGTPLGTGTLSNGVATFSSTTLPVGTNVITAVYSGDTNFSSSTASGTSGSTTVLITPLDFSIQLTSLGTVEGTYGTTRQFTFHITPIGGTYPGVVELSASPTGPILATYTFSPATIGKAAGPMDITLTVATRKLASSESPKDWSSRVSPIALGLFLLPLLGLRYSRRSASKLTRLITYSALLLLSLGGIGAMTGCGAGYFDHTYPITVTAVSNGVQHTVSVDYHIDQSPQ